MANHRSEHRVIREKFRKRSSSLFRKADELSQATEADIYIVIYQNKKYCIYKSTNRTGWPPLEQDIKNHSPAPMQRGPKISKSVGEKRDEDEQEREQADQQPVDGSERNMDTVVNQKKRVFCIPNPPVLERSPMMKVSRRKIPVVKQRINANGLPNRTFVAFPENGEEEICAVGAGPPVAQRLLFVCNPIEGGAVASPPVIQRLPFVCDTPKDGAVPPAQRLPFDCHSAKVGVAVGAKPVKTQYPVLDEPVDLGGVSTVRDEL